MGRQQDGTYVISRNVHLSGDGKELAPEEWQWMLVKDHIVNEGN